MTMRVTMVVAGASSLLSKVLRQVMTDGRAVAPDETPLLVEALEPRLLLSHVPVATPDFLLYHPIRSVSSAAASGPVGLTPSQMRHAYGIDQTMFGSVKGDGTGQTIAIVDAYNDPNIVSDLHVFDTTFGLTDPTLVRIGQDGSSTLPGTDPAGRGNSWAMEISLDVEWAHAVAPNAKIVLVEARSASTTDLFTAVNTAAHYAGVSAVSISWGTTEFSTETTYDHYFTTPAGHNGVTFVVSSGDNGAYASGGSTLGVEYPAVSANVLAVGGTTLTLNSSGNYVSESGWGSGTSSGRYGGSGGGISKYVTEPSYQKGVVTQTTTRRALPDVAFDANPASGVAVYDSWDSSAAPWVQLGGTSLAAPMWAGVIALVNQGRALAGLSSLTGSQTLSKIYALPASDFHDVTTGNNGYAAAAGFDLVTGRGTPIVNKLAPDMAGVAPSPVPVIGSLTTSPAAVQAGTSVVLTAGGVQESSGTATVTGVVFYRDSNGVAGLQIGSDQVVGSVTNPGATCSVTVSTAGFSPGTYTYYAVATDSAKATSAIASTALTILVPAPANDNFAAAATLTGSSAAAAGSNVGATKETGEPSIAGNAGGASVWYNWTASASGRVTVSTGGSNFDTLLGVYTGSPVSNLTVVASNDDASYYTLTSAVTFSAVQGVTYHIAVDGYNGATGNVALALSEVTAPPNDNFANAVKLSGRPVTWTGTNVGATIESASEPIVAGNLGGASIWFAWTATTSGTVNLNTKGSNFDTILGVYTGSSISTLKLVASNDDDPAGGTLTSAVTFNAVAGTTYYFVVDGYNGATGNVTLNLS